VSGSEYVVGLSHSEVPSSATSVVIEPLAVEPVSASVVGVVLVVVVEASVVGVVAVEASVVGVVAVEASVVAVVVEAAVVGAVVAVDVLSTAVEAGLTLQVPASIVLSRVKSKRLVSATFIFVLTFFFARRMKRTTLIDVALVVWKDSCCYDIE